MLDENYLAFIKELQERGFEIALHNVGSGAFTRSEIISGIEIFKDKIGCYPQVHINHASNPNNIYWGSKRLSFFALLYRVVKKQCFYGEKEGIPVVLMEAMSYGIPVISTNTGGIPELLAGEAGIIIEERNAKQLADSLEKIIQNKELVKEVGRRGYRKVEEGFNLDKNVKELLKIIKGKLAM